MPDDFEHVTHPPPHDKVDWVVVHLDIMEWATGCLAQYVTEGIFDPERQDVSIFGWEEGNGSCDCNRALFFAWACDADEPDVSCSDGRFAVRIRAPQSGRVIYDEITPEGA